MSYFPFETDCSKDGFSKFYYTVSFRATWSESRTILRHVRVEGPEEWQEGGK